jgi:hypothetical protein
METRHKVLSVVFICALFAFSASMFAHSADMEDAETALVAGSLFLIMVSAAGLSALERFSDHKVRSSLVVALMTFVILHGVYGVWAATEQGSRSNFNSEEWNYFYATIPGALAIATIFVLIGSWVSKKKWMDYFIGLE